MNVSGRHNKWKIGLAIAVMAVAVVVWWIRLTGGPALDPNTLRDTQGIDAEVLELDSGDGGYSVRLVIVNHGQGLAEQVVLTVSILDPDGRLVAQNPLVSLSNLPPGDARELNILVPDRAPEADNSAETEVSLVRWASD